MSSSDFLNRYRRDIDSEVSRRSNETHAGNNAIVPWDKALIVQFQNLLRRFKVDRFNLQSKLANKVECPKDALIDKNHGDVGILIFQCSNRKFFKVKLFFCRINSRNRCFLLLRWHECFFQPFRNPLFRLICPECEFHPLRLAELFYDSKDCFGNFKFFKNHAF